MRAGVGLLLAGLMTAPALAASTIVPPATPLLETELALARREAAVAEAQAQRLARAASEARDAASKLRARQLAAAEAIAAAEARISAAESELRLVGARLALQQQRLAEQQQPAASLLAGLATMARRPPLLAIVDGGSVEELVRVRILLDATMPVIRNRTAGLAAEIGEARNLRLAAEGSRRQLVEERARLADRERTFAALEAEARRSAATSQSAALGAGDVALAAGEDISALSDRARQGDSARALARELMALGPAPPGPVGDGEAERPPIAYRLPAAATVVDGVGSIGPSGIRSRGLTMATARGAQLLAPANGIIRFAGPFRSHDGVVIIDHGRGWMSLILNLRTALRTGDRVAIGQPLGRALGPIGVELSRNGTHVSPALIAGSSQTLSKRNKDG